MEPTLPYEPTPLQTLMTHSLWIHFPMIVVTNILVGSATILINKFHTIHNIIVCGLTFVDFLTGVVTLPLTWLLHHPNYVYLVKGTQHVCSFHYYAVYLLPKVSLGFMFFMSLDQFFAMKFPIKYRINFSFKKAIIAQVIIFILLTFQMSLALLFPDSGNSWKAGLSKDGNIEQCKPEKQFPKIYFIYISEIISLTMISLSLILNFNVYFIGLRRVKERFSSLKDKGSKTIRCDAELNALKRQVFQLKMTISIISIYALLWLPYMITKVVFVSFQNKKIDHTTVDTLWLVSRHCLFINAWKNAFVYASISKQTNRKAYNFFLGTRPWKWSSVNAYLSKQDNLAASTNLITWISFKRTSNALIYTITSNFTPGVSPRSPVATPKSQASTPANSQRGSTRTEQDPNESAHNEQIQIKQPQR